MSPTICAGCWVMILSDGGTPVPTPEPTRVGFVYGLAHDIAQKVHDDHCGYVQLGPSHVNRTAFGLTLIGRTEVTLVPA